MTLTAILPTAVVALLVAGGSQVAGGAADRADAGRRVIVVASPAVAAGPAVQSAVRGGDAELRTPRSPTEQLAVTHLFAARGYAIVGAGLDRRVAVDPVARRYPGVRFALLPARPGEGALRDAVATAVGR
jgi:hypothetical protein